MPSSFFGINLASSALQAFQNAMQVTSNNIANVNTPGYSRQSVIFTESNPQTFQGVSQFTYGGGVNVQNISRIRDLFLENRYVQTTQDQSRYSTLAGQLQLTQASFGDLSSDSGISTKLDNLFNAFQALSSNPSDPSARVAVKNAADALASQFRTVSSDLTQQQSTITDGITSQIGNLNDLATQVANLNKQISAAEGAGNTPNDLLDQRDTIVRQMSQLANVRTNVTSNGTMQIFVDQHTLVDSGGAHALSTNIDPSTNSIDENGLQIHVTGGQIGGSFDALNKIGGYQSSLDTLANEVITQLNALHSSGTALDGTTNHDLFQGTSAATMDLSDDVKASTDNIVAGSTGAPGDGSLALAMAQLQGQSLGNLGNRTFDQYYKDLTIGVSTDLNTAQGAADAQTAIQSQIDAQSQANSGVNLDEEMSNLLKYQQSYEAAAKMLTIMDQVLADTIQEIGR